MNLCLKLGNVFIQILSLFVKIVKQLCVCVKNKSVQLFRANFGSEKFIVQAFNVLVAIRSFHNRFKSVSSLQLVCSQNPVAKATN